MKKRLIKKKVKRMTDAKLFECVGYSSGRWFVFAQREFDKRFRGWL